MDRIGGPDEKIGSDRWTIQKNRIGSIFPIQSNRSDLIVPTPDFLPNLMLKNAFYLLSAWSNPTNVVLVIVLSMIIGKGG
jgi:hypothetical protein